MIVERDGEVDRLVLADLTLLRPGRGVAGSPDVAAELDVDLLHDVLHVGVVDRHRTVLHLLEHDIPLRDVPGPLLGPAGLDGILHVHRRHLVLRLGLPTIRHVEKDGVRVDDGRHGA